MGETECFPSQYNVCVNAAQIETGDVTSVLLFSVHGNL